MDSFFYQPTQQEEDSNVKENLKETSETTETASEVMTNNLK